METVVEDYLIVFHCEFGAGVLGSLDVGVVVECWRKDQVFYVLFVVNANFRCHIFGSFWALRSLRRTNDL